MLPESGQLADALAQAGAPAEAANGAKVPGDGDAAPSSSGAVAGGGAPAWGARGGGGRGRQGGKWGGIDPVVPILDEGVLTSIAKFYGLPPGAPIKEHLVRHRHPSQHAWVWCLDWLKSRGTAGVCAGMQGMRVAHKG